MNRTAKDTSPVTYSHTIKTTGLPSPRLTILVTLVFIVLKLTSVVDWAWGWVLSPLWIMGAVYAFLLVLAISIAFVKAYKDA